MTRVDEEICNGWRFITTQAEKTDSWMEAGIDDNFFYVSLDSGQYPDGFEAVVKAKMRTFGWFQLKKDRGTLRYYHTISSRVKEL